MSEAAHEVYVRLLLPKKLGYPLWIPEPNSELPQEYREQGLSIGDVGIVTQDGAFDFLFNICLPPDHPINASDEGLPEGFTQIVLGRKDLIKTPDMFTPGRDITSKYIKKKMLALNASSQENAVVPAELGGGFQFETNSSEGAILLLPAGGSRADLRNRSKFRKYALEHAVNWYEYTNGPLGREASNGSLYLITGCDKARAWGIASFSDNSEQGSVELKFKAAQIVEGGASYGYAWETYNSATVRIGPDIYGRSEVQNQCVFVRGFKVYVREGLLASFLGPSRVEPIMRDEKPKGNVPFSGSGGMLSRFSKGSGEGKSGGQKRAVENRDAEEPMSEEDVILEEFPETSESYHPSTVINRYLLEATPEAHVAVTHDDDWCALIDEDEDIDDDELIRQIIVHFDLEQEAGGVFLAKKEGPESEEESEEEAENATNLSENISVIPSPPELAKVKAKYKTRLLDDISTDEAPQKPIPTRKYSFKGKMKGSSQEIDRWEHVHSRVEQAVYTALNDVEPRAGLFQKAATLLSSMFEFLGAVETNRMACLRLVERCSDILLAVCEETSQLEGEYDKDLQTLMEQLVKAFSQVRDLFQTQGQQPFLKRYLQRDRILKEIRSCDAALTDTVSLLSVPSQISMLKSIQRREEQRQQDAEAIRDILLSLSEGANVTESAIAEEAAPSADLQARIKKILAHQDEQDRTHDEVDLRQLMRNALLTKNDADVLDILQINNSEIPEAIKVLQRSLEEENKREAVRKKERLEEEKAIAVAEAADVQHIKGKNESSRRKRFTGRQARRRRRNIGNIITKVPLGVVREIQRTRNAEMLDTEFIEAMTDALRSQRKDSTVPSWTITRYEIDVGDTIHHGIVADIHRATWHGQPVALKLYKTKVKREDFEKVVNTWKPLNHPNVVQLLGASSPSDNLPCFFVTPLYSNGNLLEYLKELKALEAPEVLTMMYDIAAGMDFLHNYGVVHGKLKAQNVVVNDEKRFLVAEFDSNELENDNDVFTVEWTAPEIVDSHQPTKAADVYAFSILCVEILGKGNSPWPNLPPKTIANLIKQGRRPLIPSSVDIPQLGDLVQRSWDHDSSKRPGFGYIKDSIESLGTQIGSRINPVLQKIESILPVEELSLKMPSAATLRPSSDLLDLDGPIQGHTESSVIKSFKPFDSELNQSQQSLASIFTASSGSASMHDQSYSLPEEVKDLSRLDEARNERRYRLLLNHEFHASLTLPLWSPCPVAVGAVGYLSRPKGEFVTLFNAFKPVESSNGMVKSIPSIIGNGPVPMGSQTQNKRTLVQKGLDSIQGLFSVASSSQQPSRRYSFELHAGRKGAYLVTENSTYNYIERLESPKKWFKNHIDEILHIYGPTHHLEKEDIFLVTGTLETPDYALFVSHSNPDGKVNFEVTPSRKSGQPWGTFRVDMTEPRFHDTTGPMFQEDQPLHEPVFAEKVSAIDPSKKKKDAVLLSRLRFKPDTLEPTSL